MAVHTGKPLRSLPSAEDHSIAPTLKLGPEKFNLTDVLHLMLPLTPRYSVQDTRQEDLLTD